MKPRRSATAACCSSMRPILRPTPFAAQPRCVSSTWPTFMREGTPSGFSTMSTGVPSSRYGMSSTGTMVEMTPLLPWRPAIAGGDLGLLVVEALLERLALQLEALRGGLQLRVRVLVLEADLEPFLA